MESPGTQADLFARLRNFAEGRTRELDDASGSPHNGHGPPRTEARSGIGGPRGMWQGASAQHDPTPHGRCELCSLPLSEAHRHLFEVESKTLVCACGGCALTFEGVVDGRYRVVPRDSRSLDSELAAAIPWDMLSLPINLAFFMRDGETGEVSAYYPSPGGVTRSTLPFDSIDEILDENGILSGLEPYVEALLLNRLTQKTEAFVVPIDQCYELTGLIKLNWRGFSGGEDVRREMNAFFNRIRASARPIPSA